jgi:PAS domain S-box-containing protein
MIGLAHDRPPDDSARSTVGITRCDAWPPAPDPGRAPAGSAARLVVWTENETDTEARTREHWADPERLLRSLGHAVILTDLDGVVRLWNGAAEQLYGWAADEAEGRNIAELTVPEISQELAAEIMDALRGGDSWSGGFTVRRKDGTLFPALVTDTGVSDEAGRLMGIVGVSIDLGHALRPLLARSSDAALVLTAGGTISYLSPPAGHLFGWAAETTLGVSLRQLIHPEDLPAVDAQLRLVLATPEALPPVECRVRCGDSTWRWAALVMTDMTDDRVVRGVVCNLRDVTQRHEDSDRLAHLAEQLQTALTTRVVIEQAKGIVAATGGIGVDEAFEVLRKHARDHNARLHDVASAVVTLGLRP